MKIDKFILMFSAEMGLFLAGVEAAKGSYLLSIALVWAWMTIGIALTHEKNEYEK